MSDGPELFFLDFPETPDAAARREQLERTRAEARRRYREYVAATFDLHDTLGDVDALADIAIDALTSWSDVESGERCRCGCHPHLPESDLHDFGFGCGCRQSKGDRDERRRRWRAQLDDYRTSPEGRAARAARLAEEAELETWLADHPGVVVRSHGGWAPEQWEGEVDGHSFYFRERHDEWRIELDLEPNGHVAKAFRGVDASGDPILVDRALESGEVIARGSIGAEGYGRTPCERARFIAVTIRDHLRRQECTLHRQDLSTRSALLGADVAWCPACGLRLAAGDAR